MHCFENDRSCSSIICISVRCLNNRYAIVQIHSLNSNKNHPHASPEDCLLRKLLRRVFAATAQPRCDDKVPKARDSSLPPMPSLPQLALLFPLLIFAGFYSFKLARMSSNATPLTVNVSGGHTLHRIAELCDVSFTVTHESEDRRETITKVTETANDISKALREMAPVKLVQGGSADLTASTTVEEADQAAEERDIEKPVAKWTMARLHTYSFVPYISNRKVEDREPNRKHKTSASFSATFRDFKKMEEFVNDLIVSANIGCKTTWKRLTLLVYSEHNMSKLGIWAGE